MKTEALDTNKPARQLIISEYRQYLSNKKIFSIMMAEMKFRKQLIKNTRQEQR